MFRSTPGRFAVFLFHHPGVSCFSVFFFGCKALFQETHVNLRIQYDNSLCERCQRGFQNVYAASLTIFSQIVAGDQWGAISLPMAEHSPWTAPVIFVMMTTISLGVMTLELSSWL